MPALSVSWDAVLLSGLDFAPCYFLGLNYWIWPQCIPAGTLGFIWIFGLSCSLPTLPTLSLALSSIYTDFGFQQAQNGRKFQPKLSVCLQNHFRFSLMVSLVHSFWPSQFRFSKEWPKDFAKVYLNQDFLITLMIFYQWFLKSDLCSWSRNTGVLVKMHPPRLHNLLN